jgi:hypothetical protein
MALDPSLSPSEKIGFPDEYRAGKEQTILNDILGKLSVIRAPGKTVLDIGPGCSPLAHLIIDYCRMKKHRILVLLNFHPEQRKLQVKEVRKK